MPAPAALLAVAKKGTIVRLISGFASALVLVCIMGLCGVFALAAVGAQSTMSACTLAATGTNAGVTITIPGRELATLSGVQVSVAQAYIAVGRARAVPDDGIVIALMMALQESSLRMLANPSVPASLQYPHDGTGSDHDSVGSAQQRPSAGWGSVADLMQPAYNAAAFYGGPAGPNHGSPRGLLDVTGWQAMDKGVAAQAVQSSAFPERYAQWQAEAESILHSLSSTTTMAQCTQSSAGSGQPALPADLAKIREQLIAYAQQGVGGTYIWGGTAFTAWDCSGYMQWVFAQAGIHLPRTEQWTVGHQTTDPQPGDLVVQNPDGPNHWGHVGLYAGNGMMYSALNPAVGTLLHPVSWNAGTEYFQIVP